MQRWFIHIGACGGRIYGVNMENKFYMELSKKNGYNLSTEKLIYLNIWKMINGSQNK